LLTLGFTTRLTRSTLRKSRDFLPAMLTWSRSTRTSSKKPPSCPRTMKRRKFARKIVRPKKP
jgi:hypothetical protein